MIAEIGGPGLAVLSVIASYRGSDRLCRVGRDTIAKLIGCSTSTVDRAKNRLIQKGLIEVISRGHEGWTNTYRIHLDPFNRKK